MIKKISTSQGTHKLTILKDKTFINANVTIGKS